MAAEVEAKAILGKATSCTEPVFGAIILAEGTLKGTATVIDRIYSIDGRNGDTLVVC